MSDWDYKWNEKLFKARCGKHIVYTAYNSRSFTITRKGKTVYKVPSNNRILAYLSENFTKSRFTDEVYELIKAGKYDEIIPAEIAIPVVEV